MKYRKKPVVIEAHQWWRNGDHPEDNTHSVTATNGFDYPSEGNVVRYYRHPEVPGTRICQKCERSYYDHGWIDTLEGGHAVCPGDYIITGVQGEHYPCKPDIFHQTYEPAEES